jgi:hypothetical protein
MSKKITFRGQIADGLQNKINLATLNGKTGYKITNFKICGLIMGAGDKELTAQVFTKDQSGAITSEVDFTDSNLLAVALYNDVASQATGNDEVIIFDGEVFNQDIFITAVDQSGNTAPTNYYLELETVGLSDVQATQLTLKNLRTIASR